MKEATSAPRRSDPSKRVYRAPTLARRERLADVTEGNRIILTPGIAVT